MKVRATFTVQMVREFSRKDDPEATIESMEAALEEVEGVTDVNLEYDEEV